MASKVKPFAETSTNLFTDAEYDIKSERIDGFTPNTVASSKMVNTALKEATSICTALIDMCDNSATSGKNVGPNSTVEQLREYLQLGLMDVVNTSFIADLSIKEDPDLGDLLTFLIGDRSPKKIRITNAAHATIADKAKAIVYENHTYDFANMFQETVTHGGELLPSARWASSTNIVYQRLGITNPEMAPAPFDSSDTLTSERGLFKGYDDDVAATSAWRLRDDVHPPEYVLCGGKGSRRGVAAFRELQASYVRAAPAYKHFVVYADYNSGVNYELYNGKPVSFKNPQNILPGVYIWKQKSIDYSSYFCGMLLIVTPLSPTDAKRKMFSAWGYRVEPVVLGDPQDIWQIFPNDTGVQAVQDFALMYDPNIPDVPWEAE